MVGGIFVAGGITGIITGTTGVVTTSEPIGANGFNLPSSPEGVSKILESCKFINAGSEKIASFNFILLTLNNTERRFLAIREFWSIVVLVSVDTVLEEVLEETKFA